MRKNLPQKLLRELLKNSKRSDRDLANVLKVSQPTITRARHKLEKDGIIKDYTIVPDFKKMGFEIMTIILAKIRSDMLEPEVKEKAKAYVNKFPNAIFCSLGEGLGASLVAIVFNKNYTEYHQILNAARKEWGSFAKDFQSFVVAIGEEDLKRFSLSHLKDVPIE